MKRLTVEELPRLRHIGNEFTLAAKLPEKFCEEHFEAVWKTLLELKVGTIYYEDDADGKIIGVLGAVFNPDMFSGALVAAETFWFLLPEARGNSLSIRLLDEFALEAKARGCKRILMVCLASLSPELVAAIFTRRGFTALETTYSKEI
jgi:GNAT superfamily N-acetyltransferase